MKADRFVLMGHSLGAVGCQLYLTGSGHGKFDALILTGSTILRRYRNSSALIRHWNVLLGHLVGEHRKDHRAAANIFHQKQPWFGLFANKHYMEFRILQDDKVVLLPSIRSMFLPSSSFQCLPNGGEDLLRRFAAHLDPGWRLGRPPTGVAPSGSLLPSSGTSRSPGETDDGPVTWLKRRIPFGATAPEVTVLVCRRTASFGITARPDCAFVLQNWTVYDCVVACVMSGRKLITTKAYFPLAYFFVLCLQCIGPSKARRVILPQETLDRPVVILEGLNHWSFSSDSF